VNARANLEHETSAKWWIDNRHAVNDFVATAHRNAMRNLFIRPAEEARRLREYIAYKARQDAKEAVLAAETAAQEQTQAEATAGLVGFVVASVTVQDDEDISIVAVDGRAAKAFIDGGEVVLYAVDDRPIDSDSPEAARIVHEARGCLSAQRQREHNQQRRAAE
jgi:hypothetical protein